MNINKANAAQRWYNQADEGRLFGIASVIFGYIHHAYWDVQRARAWEALKDLQTQRRQLAAAHARIVSLEAALGNLAKWEADYRLAHDSYGGNSQESGWHWDKMRRAGDKARELLAAPDAQP